MIRCWGPAAHARGDEAISRLIRENPPGLAKRVMERMSAADIAAARARAAAKQ